MYKYDYVKKIIMRKGGLHPNTLNLQKNLHQIQEVISKITMSCKTMNKNSPFYKINKSIKIPEFKKK
jgi:hypothetical protein